MVMVMGFLRARQATRDEELYVSTCSLIQQHISLPFCVLGGLLKKICKNRLVRFRQISVDQLTFEALAVFDW
jgi:hypothetical protein